MEISNSLAIDQGSNKRNKWVHKVDKWVDKDRQVKMNTRNIKGTRNSMNSKVWHRNRAIKRDSFNRSIIEGWDFTVSLL